ncbi:MAG: hypothetical protein RBT49_16530 [Bacteroidales bacterium]|jgi:biopolymer transport protein ExbD|nr:hypothetical protein [Bacteroidales bacterium]
MKKIILVIVLLIPTSLFIYSACVDSLGISKQTTPKEVVSSHDDKIVVNYENYLERMNLFVTISFAVFGLFIAVNIINGNKNLNDSKIELKNLRTELYNLKNEKDAIIIEIKAYGKSIFNDHLTHYRIKSVKEDLEKLLSEENPDKKNVFDKLSQILEHVDSLNIDLYSKCLKKFPGDPDIIRLLTRGLDFISIDQINKGQHPTKTI